MGESKKRRSSKHRGNAAGMVEARGRTGARPQGGSSDRSLRVPRPATLQRAMTKALIPIGILAPLLILTQKDTPVSSQILLLLLAYVMYVPMSYYSDRWVYNRYQRQQQQR